MREPAVSKPGFKYTLALILMCTPVVSCFKSAGGEIVAADSLNKFFQLVEWQLTETFMRGLNSFNKLHAAVAPYARGVR